MARNCSECTYIKDSGSWPDSSGNYWCTKKGKIKAYDPACYSFCKSYSRSSSDAKKMETYSKSHTSQSGCYITTIICETLGMDDRCSYLEILRYFRDNYLQRNPDTFNILIEYDAIGPIIANSIRNDQNRQEVALNLFNSYIVPTVNKIAVEKYDEAISTYVAMTKSLINRYGIDGSVPNIEYNSEQDYSQYGHGRICFNK